MRFLFKRRNKTPESNDALNLNSLAIYLEKGYLYAQSKWAEWMTKQTAKLSIKNQRAVFALFIICASGYSIYLICMSCSGTDSNRIPVTPIVKPVKTFEADDALSYKNNAISKNEFNQAIYLSAYLDSLARSPTAKKVIDSLADKHPELLDSLAEIEN
ncbi:hypothetical protein ABS764_02515 [Flavobacterium sp. ST-87]|uniref:Uncharacterized protein n=1 Tax=Flavobacterium plantiphilum TaxID=3163297 RepID=A0ABW8XR85_9FLAO